MSPRELAAHGALAHPLPEGAVHLFSAPDIHQPPGFATTLVAVCGEPIDTSELVPGCPPGCECDHPHCPACVSAALRWNAVVIVNGASTSAAHGCYAELSQS